MTKLFTQNAKMKKSKELVYNFGIPAFKSSTGLKTCPNAGKCAAGCYARSGTYGFSNVQKAYEYRLKATQQGDFILRVCEEIDLLIKKAIKQDRELVIRIHDSGDFYSAGYADMWRSIAAIFDGDVKFYAYTKQVEMIKEMKADQYWPDNFRIIYSFGGRQDHLIDIEKDFHSKVFQSEHDMDGADYVYSDASQDDMVAALGDNKNIGLIYHGVKNYSNTLWAEVL